jgi:hypothetical protein
MKSNKPFCIKAGTSVTFFSSAKDTGFIVDFGPNSPFDTQCGSSGGLCQEDEKSSCCTIDEGGPFGVAVVARKQGNACGAKGAGHPRKDGANRKLEELLV